MRRLAELRRERMVALSSAARGKVENQFSKARITTACREALAAVYAMTW